MKRQTYKERKSDIKDRQKRVTDKQTNKDRHIKTMKKQILKTDKERQT